MRLLLASKGLVHRFYLRRYFQLRLGGREEMQRWLPLQEAARLYVEIPGEREALFAVVREAPRLVGNALPIAEPGRDYGE